MSKPHCQQGVVHEVHDLEQITDRFSKRLLILRVDPGKYEQLVAFEFCNERADMLSNVFTDEEVEIDFYLRGREYNGRWYVSLNAMDITHTGVRQAQKPAPSEQTGFSDDDIPFATVQELCFAPHVPGKNAV